MHAWSHHHQHHTIHRACWLVNGQWWQQFRRGGQTCAGQYIHIYTDTRMFIAQFLCQGWFQVYVIQTCISRICDIETEGNSVVMCSCLCLNLIFNHIKCWRCPQGMPQKNRKRTNFYRMLSKNFSNFFIGTIFQPDEKILIKKSQLSSANQITLFWSDFSLESKLTTLIANNIFCQFHPKIPSHMDRPCNHC